MPGAGRDRAVRREVEALCRDDQTQGWIVETIQIGERNEGRVIGPAGGDSRPGGQDGVLRQGPEGRGDARRGTDPQKAAKAEVYRVREAAGTPVDGFAASVTERVPCTAAGDSSSDPRREHSAHKGRVRRARAGERETEEAIVSGSREKVAAATAMIGEILATMPYKPHEMHGAPPEAQARYAAQAPNGGGGGGGAGGANGHPAANGASYGTEATETVPCPFNAGAIIGARGATIREISDRTGARLVVKGNEAVTGGERVKGTEFVEIRGDLRAVAAAVAEVNRILEEKRDFVPSSSARAPGNRRVPRRVRGVRSGVRRPVRRDASCTARSRHRRSGWFRRRPGWRVGTRPFAGLARCRRSRGPPPPIPPPAPAPPVAGGDAGYVPSADEGGRLRRRPAPPA